MLTKIPHLHAKSSSLFTCCVCQTFNDNACTLLHCVYEICNHQQHTSRLLSTQFNVCSMLNFNLRHLLHVERRNCVCRHCQLNASARHTYFHHIHIFHLSSFLYTYTQLNSCTFSLHNLSALEHRLICYVNNEGNTFLSLSTINMNVCHHPCMQASAWKWGFVVDWIWWCNERASVHAMNFGECECCCAVESCWDEKLRSQVQTKECWSQQEWEMWVQLSWNIDKCQRHQVMVNNVEVAGRRRRRQQWREKRGKGNLQEFTLYTNSSSATILIQFQSEKYSSSSTVSRRTESGGVRSFHKLRCHVSCRVWFTRALRVAKKRSTAK